MKRFTCFLFVALILIALVPSLICRVSTSTEHTDLEVEGAPSTLLVNNDFLYGTFYADPAQIIKINLTTFENVSTLTFNTNESWAVALVASGNFLYAGCSTYPSKIVKVNLTDFTEVSCLTFDTGEDLLTSLFIHGDFLYAGLETMPGAVVKVNLTSFEKVSTLTLDTGEDYVTSLEVSGDFLYAGLWTSPGDIVKINITSFEKVSTLTLGANEDFPVCLAIHGDFLYAGFYVAPFMIAKVNLTSFTEVSILSDIPIWSTGLGSFLICGDYLYAGFGTTPGSILKVDLVSFTDYSILELPPDDDTVCPIAISGNFLYAGTIILPYQIVKIDQTLNLHLLDGNGNPLPPFTNCTLTFSNSTSIIQHPASNGWVNMSEIGLDVGYVNVTVDFQDVPVRFVKEDLWDDTTYANVTYNVYTLTVKIQTHEGAPVDNCPLELWRDLSLLNGVYGLEELPETDETGSYTWVQLAAQNSSYIIKSSWNGVPWQTLALTSNNNMTLTLPAPPSVPGVPTVTTTVGVPSVNIPSNLTTYVLLLGAGFLVFLLLVARRRK